MTDRERDRIESAIRHLQTAVDVDPWAVEIAVETMKEKISREPRSFSCGQENDLISRKSAIEVLEKWESESVWDEWLYEHRDEPGCEPPSLMVKQLPSAQPERKKGEWKIYIISMLDGEGCKCSECGVEGTPYWDFCPNCGADMRGGDDDALD